MRIWTWLKLLCLALALTAAAGYFIYSTDWFQKKYVYPFPYQGTVYRYATANAIDPFLVAAVIRTESKFVPAARSPKGATGLMQIMPETAEWIAGQLDYPGFTPSMLSNPEVSIRFGTWYLAELHREFNGNSVLALAAYNGGRGNVKQWMRQFGWSMDFRDTDQIPYRETREYVKKVLRDKERYRDLYGR